jgi:hypothetical protein
MSPRSLLIATLALLLFEASPMAAQDGAPERRSRLSGRPLSSLGAKH